MDLPVPQPKTRLSVRSVNGCGTMVCEGRGLIEWENSLEDCDAILAFCLLGIPLVPYRAVHTSDWKHVDDPSGNATWQWQFNRFPIRWSFGLVVAAVVRRIYVWFILMGSIATIAGLFILSDRQGQRELAFASIALMVTLGAFVLRSIVKRIDRRHQNIRYLLGRHLFGSSDPVYWKREMLEQVADPLESFHAASYAGAVEPQMAAGNFEAAMFAARLSAALEDRRAGEQLTDRILAAARVQEALQRIRTQPSARDEVLGERTWDVAALFG